MKNRKLIAIPIVVIALSLIGWLVWRSGHDDDAAITASGTIEGTEADLGFQIGGRVAQVNVREGDVVSVGSVLAQLDQAELEARRSAARS